MIETDKMKKRLYLCGPITGIPGHNKTAFDDAAAALRGAGFDVFNPLENGLNRDAPWEQHMRADLAQMMTCDALAVLPGAHFSKGATLEMNLAMQLNISPVRAFDYWLGD